MAYSGSIRLANLNFLLASFFGENLALASDSYPSRLPSVPAFVVGWKAAVACCQCPLAPGQSPSRTSRLLRPVRGMRALYRYAPPMQAPVRRTIFSLHVSAGAEHGAMIKTMAPNAASNFAFIVSIGRQLPLPRTYGSRCAILRWLFPNALEIATATARSTLGYHYQILDGCPCAVRRFGRFTITHNSGGDSIIRNLISTWRTMLIFASTISGPL